MKVIILSLGQLISSDLNKFKAAFNQSFTERKLEFNGDSAWNWLLPHLPKLRLAELQLTDLLKDFNEHFKTNLDFQEFRKNFNAMAQVDEPSLERIKSLNTLLDSDPELRVLVVSHTNWSHFESIMEQLKGVMPECRKGLLTQNEEEQPQGQLIFVPSMTSRCEKHPDTLNWALKRLNIELTHPIVSLLNTIQTLEGAEQFKYIAVGSVLKIDDIANAAMSVPVAAPAAPC